MDDPVNAEPLAVFSAGLEPGFLSTLRSACEGNSRCVLLAGAETPGELLDSIEQEGRCRHTLVVMDGEWVRLEGLELMIELQRLAAKASVLLVGRSFESLAVGHALRLGLRGITSPDVDGNCVAKMLEVIAAGELWISRQQLLEVIGLLAPLEPNAVTDVWLNLPALTQREHDVLLEVLEGKSNKAIANKLVISDQTVKIHLQHVYRKLGVHRRVDLLRALAEDRTAA